MTPEDRQLCAEFEAHLRGWEVTQVWNGCEHVLALQPDGGPVVLPKAPTPPDTADGREWFCEALKIDVGPNLDIDGSVVDWVAYAWGRGKSQVRPDRSEAVTACIVAAAKAWAGARKAGAK